MGDLALQEPKIDFLTTNDIIYIIKMTSIIRQMANYYDIDNLNEKLFYSTTFDTLKAGDIIRISVNTYSQKYTLYPGYEEYNSTKIVVLLEKNIDSPGNSTVITRDDSGEWTETIFYSDPGTSGWITIEKYPE